MNVLILESDVILRVWLEAAVRARGHCVTSCGDAEQVPEIYEAGRAS